jgi:septal ring factor EnvC (AmiA/AmiB activator)
MDKTSEAILALKPVTFHYKSDKESSPRFGLIAEEVAEVDPNLVAWDKEGKPFSVRYDQVNAMLLNEFLKEHKRVREQNRKLENQENRIQEQQATIVKLQSVVTEQQKGMKALAAHVREQDSTIQKAAAEIETSGTRRQVALNKSYQ